MKAIATLLIEDRWLNSEKPRWCWGRCAGQLVAMKLTLAASLRFCPSLISICEIAAESYHV